MAENNEFIIYVGDEEWASVDDHGLAEELFDHYCRKFRRKEIELVQTSRFRNPKVLKTREAKHG